MSVLDARLERWRRQARADRQSGAMPSEIRDREDADELWGAFRSHVGTAWTGARFRDFMAGWDARRSMSGPVTDGNMARAFRRLHVNRRNGYERGDCHCEACGVIVDELTACLGLRPPPTGIFDPAEQIREIAAERGWER